MEVTDLNNLKFLRAALKNTSEDFVNQLISKLEKIKDEIKFQKEKEQLELQKKEELLQSAIDSLKGNNLTIDELIRYCKKNANFTQATDGRSNVAPKYRYLDLNGRECLWSGRGKMPTSFQEAMNRDQKDKVSYLINQVSHAKNLKRK